MRRREGGGSHRLGRGIWIVSYHLVFHGLEIETCVTCETMYDTRADNCLRTGIAQTTIEESDEEEE